MTVQTVQALTERARHSAYLAKCHILRRRVHEARETAAKAAHYGFQLTHKLGDGIKPCIKCSETVTA